MPDSLLNRPIVHMPSFAGGEWLNAPRPVTKEQLRGQVVLVDFWDYTCINCLRTLPYLKAWHRRYAGKGLTIIGVHAPEFRFGRGRGQVAAAIAEYELPYPVLLDNEYETWDRFAAKAWPTKVLIDPAGYVRLRRQGEGYYRQTERAIQLLLRQRDHTISLPDLLPPLRDEDAPGAVCYKPTREVYAGYQGGGLFSGGLGNAEGYTENPMAYTLPGPFDRREGHFYLAGFWRAEPEAVVFVGEDVGRVVVRYAAAGVNAVLSPSSDPVELMLDLRRSEKEPLVEVRQDDAPLTPDTAGADVFFDDEGRSLVRVTRPRMMSLVRNQTFGDHELDLILRVSGMALYAFTFTSCVAGADAADTYQVR